jgi:TolA-binding protein
VTQANKQYRLLISYSKSDQQWAEWVAWQLEEDRYSTILQAWDFRPGSNALVEMHEAIKNASHVIAILSPSYLETIDSHPECTTAFKEDTLLPVKVRACETTGIFASIIHVDLVGLNEFAAREMLFQGLQSGRVKPIKAPIFPYEAEEKDKKKNTRFRENEEKEREKEKEKERRKNLLSRKPDFPGSPWTLPPRSLFFTGREEILEELHKRLTSDKTVALVQAYAINGLGGIGKTQTAMEYAYRYRDDYHTILWAQAESSDILAASFVSLADQLGIPDTDKQDQNRIIDVFKHWLKRHSRWLLILDNVEDLKMVQAFSTVAQRGHILVTTRSQAVGAIAYGITLEKMELEVGAQFLLRRAKILLDDGSLNPTKATDPEKTRNLAKELSQILDGLPLALDQAGAYIEEASCDISKYIDLYNLKRSELLKERGTLAFNDHPESVTVTFSLNFKKVKQSNPTAAHILQVCSFLSPDAIPEEIITDGASELGMVLQRSISNPFLLEEAFKELSRHSLVQRLAEAKTLTIHRLVQAVLVDELAQKTQRQWVERIVRAMNRVFPEVDLASWSHCQELLPHVLACAPLIRKHNLDFPEAALLLHRTGYYLSEQARYDQAESLFQLALTIYEKLLKPQPLAMADTQYELGRVYYKRDKYEKAEDLYRHALTIREQRLGYNHPKSAITQLQLATVYRDQGQYEKAEQLFLLVLAICEWELGYEHSYTGSLLHEFARLYHKQRKYEQAKPFYERALAIREHNLGRSHPLTASTLHQLAMLNYELNHYEEARQYFRQALEAYKRTVGVKHPDAIKVREDYANFQSKIRKKNN